MSEYTYASDVTVRKKNVVLINNHYYLHLEMINDRPHGRCLPGGAG